MVQGAPISPKTYRRLKKVRPSERLAFFPELTILDVLVGAPIF